MDFSSENMQTRRDGMKYLKSWEKKTPTIVEFNIQWNYPLKVNKKDFLQQTKIEGTYYQLICPAKKC